MSGFSQTYLCESIAILEKIDPAPLDRLAEELSGVRNGGGRLFILGIGGSAAHASHAVNDFRKICQLEAYTPLDNVSELTARINDEGWESSLSEWLKISRLGKKDALLIFSVGGGNSQKKVSVNLVEAIKHAETVGAKIFGIVGKGGGYTKVASDICVVIPTVNPERITPHTEGLCAVIWHLLVSHPKLKRRETNWEGSWHDGSQTAEIF